MELHLMCTSDGLKPLYDDDFDKKKYLKEGVVYKAKISIPRNLAFHRKYFSLVNTAWEYLDEKQRSFFGDKQDSFRKCVEVSAGSFELIYSVTRNEWQQVPKSISFGKMSEEEFENLYERVKDVIFKIFLSHINEDEFMNNLIRY